MKEFKYIFKVDHTNPQKTLQMLGEKVVGAADAFSDIDLRFVQSQDFITAVPIEIALTTEMRSNLIYQNPVCRFVITGVPVHRIKNLVEYGYAVFTNKVETPEEPCEDKDECSDAPDLVENDAPVDERLDVLEETQGQEIEEKDGEVPAPATESKAKYWVDGKEASKEEFDKAVEKFKLNTNNSFFKGLVNDFFGW